MVQTVFVCAPVAGDVEANLEKIRAYCKELVKNGSIPVAPVLMSLQFLDDNIPAERVIGMRIGHEMMRSCNSMHVLGTNVTKGMAADITAASKCPNLSIEFKVQYKGE